MLIQRRLPILETLPAQSCCCNWIQCLGIKLYSTLAGQIGPHTCGQKVPANSGDIPLAYLARRQWISHKTLCDSETSSLRGRKSPDCHRLRLPMRRAKSRETSTCCDDCLQLAGYPTVFSKKRRSLALPSPGQSRFHRKYRARHVRLERACPDARQAARGG